MRTIVIIKKSINSRTLLMRKNVFYNFGIKGIAFLVNLLIVSYTYNFLNSAELFGIWSVILMVINWTIMMDLGLGNGMRNELISLIAKREYKEAKVVVSTSYFYIFISVVIMMIFYLILTKIINWNEIFKTDYILINESINVIIIFSLLSLILNLIFSVAHAYQKSYIPGFYNLITNILIIFSLWFVSNLLNINNSLFLICVLYSLIRLVVYFIANIYLFQKSFNDVKFNIKLIKPKKGLRIVNAGIYFFILQILTLIVMGINNFIILQKLGPEAVTEYQLAFNLFNILIILAGVIFSPLWSAYRDAYVKEDYEWMKKALRNNRLLFLVFVFLAAAFTYFGNDILKIWISKEIEIDFTILLLTGIYSLLIIWQSIHAYLLNSMNKLKFQMTTFTIGLLLGIPLSIKLGEIFGVPGVIIGSITSLSLFSILAPIILSISILKTNNENS